MNSFCNERHYIGEIGTVFHINCGVDVSLASVALVYLYRPDGTVVEKEATVETYLESPNYVYFTIAEEDFNQAGDFLGQVYIEIGSWKGRGEKFEINVEEGFSSSSSCRSSSSSSSY